MATHATEQNDSGERLRLGEDAVRVYKIAAIVGVLGLSFALLLGDRSDGLRRFYFAYLAAFVFFLSIVLGALFMVLMQHLTRAGWSVGVRRIAEQVAGLMPALALLSVPIVLTVVMQNGVLYRWALPMSAASQQSIEAAKRGEPDEAAESEANAPPTHAEAQSDASPKLDSIVLQKRTWLNPWFFAVRVAVYFAIWSAMALWYRGQSLRQDQTGDVAHTRRLRTLAGICVVILGLTLTGAAGDFIMSLDPHWFSTMFGVYYFAGSAVSSWAMLTVIVYLLQNAGYLRKTINKEHYHDLGKYLFGFTFFWGYIAFSQYMLLWYANIPEEIAWYSRHGATTVSSNISGWTWVIVAILFGQLLIPFAGLLSRHVKRRQGVLVFWAVWVLAFHALDSYWMVMPEYAASHGATFRARQIIIDLAAFAGVGGVLLAVLIRSMMPHSLRPARDPRLEESLAFHNF